MSSSKRTALFSEESRLEYRIARDTRRLATLRSRSHSAAEAYIASAALDRKRFARKSYILFLFDTVTSTRGFELWDGVVGVFRRFRLISTTLRIAAVIISAIETGAAFILAAGIVLALSPAILLFLTAVTLDSAISGLGAVKEIRRIAADGAVTFVFPPRGALGRDRAPGGYGSLALSGTVIIVSPYLISARGDGGRGGYSSLRRERENVYIIRRRMYFVIRRRLGYIFRKKDTTLIYL